jgi:hypothetical protein
MNSPHQGIEQNIPCGFDPPDRNSSGTVRSKEILGGICHHYYKEAA